MNNFVIVVDDSPTIRTIIQQTIQKKGYNGASFPNGEHALRWLDHYPDMPPGLIFSDIHLPDINGYELARKIKSDHRFTHTVVVLMSSQQVSRMKMMASGAVDYIHKPFDIHDILKAVREYVPIPPTAAELHQARRNKLAQEMRQL